MKRNHAITYKKITRATYLLGIIFLLAGMMLSMVSQPAEAGFSAVPTSPVIRTPEGPQPTVAPQLPPHNPDNPGIPGRRIPGRNAQNFNFSGQADAPRVPNPPVRLMLSAGSARFTQSDYCLAQPGPGWIDATVVISLAEGETALLATDWYVVHPNPYPDDPSLNQSHREIIAVTNGQRVTWQAYWPGASLFPTYDNPGNPLGTIEIHWGAQLYDTDNTPFGPGIGLDAYYNGSCNTRPALKITKQCLVGGGIQWSLTNPGFTAVNASYEITDGPSGDVTVAGGGTEILGTTTGGAHTATVTYDNGLGELVNATASSEDGECLAIRALSVSHACGPNGIVFTASNPNAFPVEIEFTDGTTVGTTSVSANGTVDFLTLPSGTAHAVTISWDNQVGGRAQASDSSTADECGSQPSLVVTHLCKEGGGILWRVRNDGTASVNFEWSLDNGAMTGSDSIAGGDTKTAAESSGGIHRFDVTWPTGSAFDTSALQECGGTPAPSLSISRQCVEGGIQWSVTNNGTLATSFTWTLDTDADSGSGSVGIGETAIVTTSSGGAHLLVVNYDGNSIFSQSNPEDCGGGGTLTIGYACAVDGGIQWAVSNSGTAARAFTWSLDNDTQTGGGSAPAGGSTDVVVSTGGIHSLSIQWDGGSATRSSTSTDCNPLPVTLGLRWQCSEDNSGVDWLVVNNNGVDVSFQWSLDGAAFKSDVVQANSTRIIHVAGHDSHQMSISWVDEIGAYTLTDTNPGNVCILPEEPNLTISLRCVMENTVEWRVVNSGDSDVDFEWSLDTNAQTGSDTAPANGRKVFLVTSGGQHSVTVTWPENNSYTRTTASGFCGIITRTNTPTPTGDGTPQVGVTPGRPNIPQTGGTPVPTLSAPGDGSATSGQGVAVSPVTGIDLNALSSAQLIQRLLTNLGLLFLGVALALTGFGSRLK